MLAKKNIDSEMELINLAVIARKNDKRKEIHQSL